MQSDNVQAWFAITVLDIILEKSAKKWTSAINPVAHLRFVLDLSSRGRLVCLQCGQEMHVKPEGMERTSDGSLHRRPHLAHVEQFPGRLTRASRSKKPKQQLR